MKIDDNYTVDKTADCFILRYEKHGGISKKTGDPIVSKDQTYHISLKDALKSYVNKVVEPSQTSLAVLSQLEQIEDTITNLKLN